MKSKDGYSSGAGNKKYEENYDEIFKKKNDIKLTCTSLRCQPPTSYCKKCSHANFSGQGKDSTGKFWKFDFNPKFGPLFLRTDEEPLINQPKESSKAWEVFDQWFKIYQKQILSI